MNTNKGLILDGFSLESEDKKYNKAVNVILTPDKLSIQNEPGFIKQKEIIGTLIGNIETPNEIIDFYDIYEDHESVLAVYRENTLIFKTVHIPHSIGNPISGTYQYNYKNELIIIWCSGTNTSSDEIRYFNCDNPQVALDNHKNITSNIEALKTLLNSSLPKIEMYPANVTNGGILASGTYFLALSFNITNYDKTSYSYLSDPIYLINSKNSNNIGFDKDLKTNNSIFVNMNCDVNIYNSCNIAILYFNGTTTIVKILENVTLKYNGIVWQVSKYISDISNLSDGSLDEVLIRMNPYIKTNIITNIKNKMIIGGNKIVNSVNNVTQIAANKIYFKCRPVAFINEMNMYDLQEYGVKQTFQEGEVYAFYAGYRYIKGGYISIVHIPGPDANNYKTTSLHPLECKNPNEYYDNDFPELGGLQVRHHKMPSYRSIIDELNAVKATITNNAISWIIGDVESENQILFNLGTFNSNNGFYNSNIISNPNAENPTGVLGLISGNRIIFPDYNNRTVNIRVQMVITIIGITDNIGMFLKLYNNSNLDIDPLNEYANVSIASNVTPIETLQLIPTSVVHVFGVGQQFTFNINYTKKITSSVFFTVGCAYPNISGVSGTTTVVTTNITADTIKEFTLDLEVMNVEIPEAIYDICNGVDIFCAKRGIHNSRIIEQDLIHTRFINHCVPYGEHPADINDELYNENKTDLYCKGHAYSLLHAHPDISFVKQIEVYGFNDTFGDDSSGLYNGGSTMIPITSVIAPTLKTPTDTIQYIKNNNAVVNNIRGESAIKISINLKSLLGPNYQDSYGRGTNFYTQRVFYFINYISTNTDFYMNYRNQELIKLGSGTKTSNILKGDIFYCSQYGIRTSRLGSDLAQLPSDDNDETRVFKHLLIYPIKSHYNLSARFEGLLDNQKIYPHTTLDKLMKIPTIYDNFIKRDTDDGFNVAYNKRCDYYTYVNSHRDDDTKINKNIIAVSNVQATESKSFRWRYFDPSSYKSIPFNKGFIINILSNGTMLYIQSTYALFIASIKDVLNLANNEKAYLGNADIFDRDPEEIISHKDGFIGCQHKYATTINENGYFVVDSMKRKIFWISDQKVIVSDLDATRFFNTDLSVNTVDNPYLITEGIELISDNINTRIIYSNNKTNTKLSFSMKGSIWVSEHQYGSFKLMSNRLGIKHYIDNVITTINGGNTITTTKAITSKQTTDSEFGRYGDYLKNPIDANIKQSYLDIIFNSEEPGNTLLQSILWKTNILINNVISYTDSIDFIMIYNKTQCSGLIDILKSNAYYFKDSALLKNDTWFFNNFQDCVIDDKLAILDTNKMPTANVNKLRKPWYKQSQFISDIHIVRFGISKNITNRRTILNMVDMLTIKDNR